MTELRRLLIVFLILTATVCCGRHGAVWEKLQCARQVMDEHPDSALSILQTIAYSSLTGDEEKALYGMLYVQALDKNQFDPANDSIISHSVEYYAAHKKIPEQIISTYYRGRTLRNGGRYPQALVCFYKSKELAERHGEYFWAGMSCWGISDVYKETFHFPESESFARKEYYYIKKSGRQPYLNYALHDHAWTMKNSGGVKNLNTAIKISKQLIDSASKYNDPYLYSAAIQMRGHSLVLLDRYKEALPAMSEVCDDQFSESCDSIYLVWSLYENGRYRDAEELMGRISDEDLLFKKYIENDLLRHNGNYEKVLSNLYYLQAQSDSIFKASMSENFTTSLSNYLEITRNIDEEKINSYRKLNVLYICIVCLIVAMVAISVKKYLDRQSKKINDKVLLAEQLKEELERTKQEKSESDKIVESILSSQYELLEQFAGIVIQANDTRKAKKMIADSVTELIEDLSIGGDKMKELEARLDSLYDNVYSDFKRDLPNLREMDCRLFLFSALKLSNAAISILLKEEKIDAVYNRKRRLKDKIKKLDSDKSERYLSFL